MASVSLWPYSAENLFFISCLSWPAGHSKHIFTKRASKQVFCMHLFFESKAICSFAYGFFFYTLFFHSGVHFYGTDTHGQADHSGRQRQIRRSLHLQRGFPHGAGRNRGQLLCTGVLPRLYRRRPLCEPAQGADDQLLLLRLRLLRQPQVQRYPPRHLCAPGAGRADHGVLPPQLHRGAVFVQRGAGHPGLHHRADADGAAAAAGRIPLWRLHPRQGHPRHQPGACAAAGVCWPTA